ncbi:hypothetical protein AAG906_008118 [Vitis piasezkii]
MAPFGDESFLKDNYLAWKRAMILALNSKNKLGFVNGSIKAPLEETDPEEQLSVSAYYTKLKGLWDELASYNAAAHGA